MARKYFLTAIVLAALALTVGCPKKKPKNGSEDNKLDLESKVKIYNEGFFWRDYETISLMVLPSRRRDFLNYCEELGRGYTQDEFKIMEIQMNPTKDKAVVVVKRKFIMPPSVILQTKEITQEWVLYEGEWYLSGPPY